jgi:hypothetical protein
MKWIAAALFLIPLVSAAPPHFESPSAKFSVPSNARDSFCMPRDSAANKFLRWAKKIASDSDSASVALRKTFGVPWTAQSDVALVSDETLCQRASLAADSSGRISIPSGGKVHLAKIGSGHYAVHRVGWQAGEWGVVFIFDSTFARTTRAMTY